MPFFIEKRSWLRAVSFPFLTETAMSDRNLRSSDPDDYQFVPRPLAAMAKSFDDGYEIAPHHHARDQLVYAVTGVMRVRTAREAWIVPLTVPSICRRRPFTASAFAAGSRCARSTLLATHPDDLPVAPTVLEVSSLLRELVLAMIEEPVIYDEKGAPARSPSCCWRRSPTPDGAHW